MPAPQPLPSRLIGALFVERGLVSESQVRVALEIQRETGEQLGEILVERFGVSRKELASVVAEQWAKLGGSAGPEDNASWRRLGDIFVERGFVTQEELDGALERQRQTGERIGEALVAQGVISKFELAGALAEQMSELGEPEPVEEPQEEPQQATVHHLPRPEESSAASPEDAVAPDVAAAFLEVVPDLEPESEPELALVDFVATPEAEAEPVEEVALEAEADPVEEVAPELEVTAEWVAEPEPERVAQPEPVFDAGTEWLAEPQPEPELEQGEAFGDVEALPDPEPEVLAEPVEEPLLAQVSFDDPTETDDAGLWEDAPAADPSVACFAFTPTTRGYVLVPLAEIPSAGQTIHVPDVGERVVLRVGSYPLPLDGRVCAFVEEPVTPPVADTPPPDHRTQLAERLARRPRPTLTL